MTEEPGEGVVKGGGMGKGWQCTYDRRAVRRQAAGFLETGGLTPHRSTNVLEATNGCFASPWPAAAWAAAVAWAASACPAAACPAVACSGWLARRRRFARRPRMRRRSHRMRPRCGRTGCRAGIVGHGTPSRRRRRFGRCVAVRHGHGGDARLTRVRRPASSPRSRRRSAAT